MKLYEILVPAKAPLKHHKAWDKRVAGLVGGLSVFRPIKGKWKSHEGVISEEMIPVRLATDAVNMRMIAALTARHYRQRSVMYYEVSPDVYFYNRGHASDP